MTKAGGVTVADSEQVELEHRQAVLALREAQRNLDLTRAVAPLAIFLVLSVTVTTTFIRAPSSSVSLYTHRLPGSIGQ